ncbi:MAG TPA: GNAT family N-acetyltransferase [Nitrospirota bacterium]|nr:GNAT family N-acetyltransferase [Nitrospirota bacterium]
MNLVVRLLPTGWKYWRNHVQLKTPIGDSGPVTLPEAYTWTWAGPEEIDFLDRHPEATSPTAYARRAARGDRCLCIKQGGEVVGYRWFKIHTGCILCGFGPNMEITPFPLQPGQAFAYDLFTYRMYRGMGIATLLNNLLYHALREAGIKEILALVSTANHAALRLNLRLGAQPQRLVYSYRIRGWSKTFLGPEGDRRLIEWMQQFKTSLAPGLSRTNRARRNQA